MPTAGRVSRPDGVVVGEVERGLVVCGTVVCGVDELVGGRVVTAGEGVIVGGVVTAVATGVKEPAEPEVGEAGRSSPGAQWPPAAVSSTRPTWCRHRLACRRIDRPNAAL